MHSDSSCLLNSVLQITKTQQLRISKRVKDSKYGASLQTPQISSIKRPQDVPKHGLSRSLTHKTQRIWYHRSPSEVPYLDGSAVQLQGFEK